jgi:hypothetical protein
MNRNGTCSADRFGGVHMADVRKQDEAEPPSSSEQEKNAESQSNPTAAEQKDVNEVVADEYRDDRFQASDN